MVKQRNKPKKGIEKQDKDYDIEDGLLVFSASYLLKRGRCCGCQCRNCPYEKPKSEDNTQ